MLKINVIPPTEPEHVDFTDSAIEGLQDNVDDEEFRQLVGKNVG